MYPFGNRRFSSAVSSAFLRSTHAQYAGPLHAGGRAGKGAYVADVVGAGSMGAGGRCGAEPLANGIVRTTEPGGKGSSESVAQVPSAIFLAFRRARSPCWASHLFLACGGFCGSLIG